MSIEKLYKQFPDVHPNIVLKTDALRQGIDISDAAMENFRQRNDLLWKGFHLFSYDFRYPSGRRLHRRRAPGDAILDGRNPEKKEK